MPIDSSNQHYVRNNYPENPPKPDKPARYVIIGDSLSIGLRNTSVIDDPPVMVHALIGRTAAKAAAEYTYSKYPRIYDKDVKAYFIWLGTNDSSAASVGASLTILAAAIRSHNKTARIIFGSLGYAVDNKKEINKAIREASEKTTYTGLLELGDLWDSSDNLSRDKIHLSVPGYTKAAQRVWNVLRGKSSGGPSSDPDSGKSSNGDDGSSSSSFEAWTKPGSFIEVKKYIDPKTLHKGQVFNPPLHIKDEWRKNNRWPNKKGFIVRDPLFQQKYASDYSEESWLRFQTPYGFRFLYNPSDYSESYTTPADGDPIRAAQTIAKGFLPPIALSGISLNFTLFLSRFEDRHYLMGNNWKSLYPDNTMTAAQRDAIINYGTQSDIEYLFRLCNGEPQTTWTGETSDWGYLLPTMSVISMGMSPGARRMRGYIQAIGWQHEMFIEGMIPMYTMVSISFARIMDAYYEQAPDPKNSTQTGSTSGTTSSSSNGNTSTSGTAVTGDAAKVIDYAKSLLGKFNYTSHRPPQIKSGLDCSAFVWWVYDNTFPGALKGQNTGQQVKEGKVVAHKKDLEPGDLVFYGSSSHPSHVAIYMGNGKVIHSSNPSRKQATTTSLDTASRNSVCAMRRILKKD